MCIRRGICLLVAALLVSSLVVPPAFSAPGALDGKTFVGEMGKKGEKAFNNDEHVIFQDGKMTSSVCASFGYGGGAYTTTPAGNATQFQAEITHPTEGTQKWIGTVKGDTLEAISVSQKPGEAPTEMWVKGRLQE